MHILQTDLLSLSLSQSCLPACPCFSFKFKCSMAIVGFFFLLSQQWWTSHYRSNSQCLCNVLFPFFSRQCHSFSVPFEDSFRWICRKRLRIHTANTFTNVLVNLHCRQIWAVLWMPSASHFYSGTQLLTRFLWLYLLCSSTGKLCFKAFDGLFPFHPPFLTSDWAILSHPFVIFLDQRLHVFSYALMFHRWLPWSSTYNSLKFFKFFEKHSNFDVC